MNVDPSSTDEPRMKTRRDAESVAWQEKCLNMGKAYAGVTTIAGVLLIIFQILCGQFISLNVDDNSISTALNIVHIVLSIVFTAAYVLITIAVMLSDGAKNVGDHAPFHHGIVIGFGLPFSMFLLAQSTLWWERAQPIFAAVGVLSAILSGMALGGTFLYWVILSPPVSVPDFREPSWMSKKHAAIEISLLAAVAAVTLGAIVTMLMMTPGQPGSQVFSTAILAFTYLVVLSLGSIARMTFRSHLMLGVLTGATIGVMVISAILTFLFVSNLLKVVDITMPTVAACFQAGLFLILLPLIATWIAVEYQPKSLGAEHAGPGKGHIETGDVPFGSRMGA